MSQMKLNSYFNWLFLFSCPLYHFSKTCSLQSGVYAPRTDHAYGSLLKITVKGYLHVYNN